MKKIILFYRENTRFFKCSLLHLTRVFIDWCLTSFSQEGKFIKNWFYRLAFLLLVFSQISSFGQSNTNNSQWGKNGPASAPATPVNWANGNAQGTNSHFTEGQSIPTRIELDGLIAGQPASVTFNINIIQGSDGQHAFDFFTGPNRIEETVSPLDGLSGYNPVKSTYVFPIPNAFNTGGVPASYYNETALKMACQQNADAAFPDKNSIWIYNGTVSNITYVWGNEDGASTQQTYCTVTFTPTSTKVLLVLGCHIGAELTASCAGWGIGNGASTISGSPYHFHIHNICSPLSNCITLGSQDQQMASNSVIVPPTCSITPSFAEICAGATATFTATGINGSGGAPYSFVWSGPNGFTATTSSITVGVAGTYSVVVSDKNGVPTLVPCTANLIVNDNPIPSVDDEEACVGSTATFSTTLVSGFSYQWYLNNVLIPNATNNSYTTPALTLGDNGGIYKVIVVNVNHNTDCDGEDSGTLTVNPLPVVVANNSPVCAGFTVQLTASPSGGTWSGDHISASGLFDSSGLSAGTYNVTYTYTDGNQCVNSDGAVVTVNALPVVVANDAPVCAGFTVQLTASPSGGTWSGDHISASGLFDSSGLSAGTYNVTYTYTDGNQCTNSDVAVVTVNALPTVVANDAPVCAGFTVQLSASPSGGTWSGDHISASGLFDSSGLSAGTYNVIYTYTDANQCTNSDVAVVTVNALPIVVANDAPVCAGFTVQLTASPSGGTWSGDHISASGLFDSSGLSAGTYNVTYTYTDGNQCTNSDVAVVTVNALPIVDCPDNSMDNLVQCGVSATSAQTLTNSSFNTWFGSFATLNSSLEVINVTYDYEPNSAQPPAGNAPLNPTLGVPGVVETSVLVTWFVKDENGCESSCSATFALSYNCTIGCENTMTPVLCYGASTGSITVVAQGGTPPYTVNLFRAPDVAPYRTEGPLNTGAISVVFDNLPAGTYSYSVTDATNGDSCNNNEPIVITQPLAALSSIISDVDVLCYGEGTGSIDLTPSGGTPPYTYAWTATNGGQVPIGQEGNQDLTDLIAGTYSVIITDANGTTGGCRAENSPVISQPDKLSCSIDVNSDEQCAGGLNGSATVNVIGGIGEYSYLWDNNETTATASGLSGGLHSVTVTDSNGCSTTCEITIQTIPCEDGHCAYTQGFYGNYNGLGCTPDYGIVNSNTMMVNALNQVGGLYNFGSTNTGNYFQLKLSDVTGAVRPKDNKIYKMLPGGGTPRKLSGFATYDVFSTWSDNDPLTATGSKKGAINNNLLSQTMTLFFNIQMDSSLAFFELESSFATAASVDCGSNIPNMETIQVFNIPQGIIDYLSLNGGATVGNLFALANKALGGENIGGISHSNVNAAVDAINRGFDKCRIRVAIPEYIEVEAPVAESLNIIVSPNPFKDYINLNYLFEYYSSVEIQIFNSKGVLLYEFKDNDAYYGKEMRIDVNFNYGKGELFIIKLVTNKESIILKLISSNY